MDFFFPKKKNIYKYIYTVNRKLSVMSVSLIQKSTNGCFIFCYVYFWSSVVILGEYNIASIRIFCAN